MAAPLFIAWAADVSALTGPPNYVASSGTSGTSLTALQVKPGTPKIRIVEWGYTINTPPATPLRVELVETDVAATVTTIGSGVLKYNDATGSASQVATGTSATGFNASAEGTITASRLLDYQYENGLYFKKQFPLGREPEVNGGKCLRVRVTPTSNAVVNIFPYVIWEE